MRQSKNPCLVGLSGIVIYESENGFRVITRGNELKSGSLCLGPSGRRAGVYPTQCYPNRTAFLGLEFRSIRQVVPPRQRRFRMDRTSNLSCMGTNSGSVLQTGHHESLSTKRALSCNSRKSSRGIFSVFFLVTTMFPSYPLLETEPGDGKRVTTMALPSRPQVPSFYPDLFPLVPFSLLSHPRPFAPLAVQCPTPLLLSSVSQAA